VKSIWYSTFTLYAGDSIMVAMLLAGAIEAVGTWVRHTRKFIVLDLPEESLRNFCFFQIMWLMCGLVLFKAVVIQGGPHIGRFLLTGAHGSDQFSTAGEAVGFAIMLYGLYRWCHWGIKTLRRVTQ
jgi:hypothetical protein